MATTIDTPPAEAATPPEQTPPAAAVETPLPPVSEPKQDGADQARTAFMGDGDFWANIMGADKKPKAEEPAVGEDAAAPAAAVDPPKPKKAKSEKPVAEPETPAAPPKKIVRKRDAEDDQRIVDVATTAAVRAAAAVAPAPAAPTPTAQPDNNAALLDRLDDEAREDAVVLVEIGRLNPKRAGLLKEFVEFKSKSEPDYVRKWEREHPGQKFDREDESHDAFYDEHEPVVSDGERRKAEREIMRREARDEAERAVAPIRERAETEARTREIAPAIQNVEANALGYMLETMKPEAGETLRAEGGFEKLKESDPELIETAVGEFARVRPLLTETVKIFSGATRPDPAKNPVHKEFIDVLVEIEGGLANKTDKSGRMFSPIHEFVRMTPDQQARHWIVDQGDVLVAIAQKAAGKASETYQKDQDRFETWAKRRGVAPKTASETTPKAAVTPAVAAAPKPSNGAPPSPSPSGSGRIQVDTNPAKPDDNADSFVKFFGTGSRPR